VTFLESLKTRARALRATLAFPEASDPRTAAAIAQLLSEGICSVVAVGSPRLVGEALAAVAVDADAVDIVDPANESTVDRYAAMLLERMGDRLTDARADQLARDPLMVAGLLVGEGRADGVVAGAVHSTSEVIRAAIRTIGPAEGVESVSSVFYMLVPSFRGVDDEVLTFADAGVIPEPTSQELADIGVAAARARALVVDDQPRVAFLSYSTLGSASGEAVDKVIRAVELFRERLPEVPVDGELQGDAALIESVARHKAPGSSVAGKANVLIFPDLNSANIAYKLVQRITGGRALGPILQGLRRPYNDLSRGASVDEVFDVACITSLMGKGGD
jgi:phosphate acetyltransferase